MLIVDEDDVLMDGWMESNRWRIQGKGKIGLENGTELILSAAIAAKPFAADWRERPLYKHLFKIWCHHHVNSPVLISHPTSPKGKGGATTKPRERQTKCCVVMPL